MSLAEEEMMFQLKKKHLLQRIVAELRNQKFDNRPFKDIVRKIRQGYSLTEQEREFIIKETL